MVLVPGAVELGHALGAAPGGEQGVAVGVGTEPAQQRALAERENLGGSGDEAEVVLAAAAEVERDALEHGDAGIALGDEFGDVDGFVNEVLGPGEFADLVEKNHTA